MTALVESPSWLLVMICIIALIAIISAKRRKWTQRHFTVGVCEHCGTSQPGHAAYCRQCGKRL